MNFVCGDQMHAGYYRGMMIILSEDLEGVEKMYFVLMIYADGSQGPPAVS